MSKSSSSPISDDTDEYPQVTQADLDRAVFRVGLEPRPQKERVAVSLDVGLVELFKARAGEHDFQELINDTLRQALGREELEQTLRRVMREELHQGTGRST